MVDVRRRAVRRRVFVPAVAAGLCLSGCGANASQGASAGSGCGVPKSYACAQAEDEELPGGEAVLAKATAMYGARYASIWWDRDGPKSAIIVAVVAPTVADRRIWAAAWGDNPRLVLVGQRYTERQLARFAAVADPLLRRHLRVGTASADVVNDKVLVEIYPTPAQQAEARAVRGELAGALPADAYRVVEKDGTPRTTIDPASWFLIAADGPVLTLGVLGGGCTFYDHIDVSERSNGVRIAAFDRTFDQPGTACTLELSCRRVRYVLRAPLGDRPLAHPVVRGAGPPFAPDYRRPISGADDIRC